MFIIPDLMTLLSTYTIEETGLYEIHAEVQWSLNTDGHRFFHTKHEPVPPCISEAIEANILYSLSDMKQRMTGHVSLVEGTNVDFEVWSDVYSSVEVITFEVIKV